MVEAGWIALNALVFGPLALAILVVGRELARAVVGLGFRFRIFEIDWGMGRRIVVRPLGPIDFGLRAIPVAGKTVAASGSPRRHRSARLAMAGGPLGLQIVWLLASGSALSSFATAIAAGPAPWAMLELANAALLALHLLIPFETHSGIRSDVRMLLDVVFGRAESSRFARASYYARLARHRLERADVAGARAALENGLIQLGREALLVDCEACLAVSELGSVVDQGACADALRERIARAQPGSLQKGASASRLERLRQAAITALPLGLALVAGIGLASDRIAQRLHDRWLARSDEIVAVADARACASWISRGSIWTGDLARLLPDKPERRRDREQRIARLERCRGDLDVAAAHLDAAVSAADAIRAAYAARSRPERLPWLESELRFANLLCDGAELDNDRGAFRLALATLARAESALELARNRVATWTEPPARARATERVEQSEAEIAATRVRVLSRMASR